MNLCHPSAPATRPAIIHAMATSWGNEMSLHAPRTLGLIGSNERLWVFVVQHVLPHLCVSLNIMIVNALDWVCVYTHANIMSGWCEYVYSTLRKAPYLPQTLLKLNFRADWCRIPPNRHSTPCTPSHPAAFLKVLFAGPLSFLFTCHNTHSLTLGAPQKSSLSNGVNL